MDFSDKINRLLSLTGTQGSQLAKNISLDPSQISRMKNGVRGKPNNLETIWAMSSFFSKYCQKEYHLSVLSELTGDGRLINNSNDILINEVIFTWLCNEDNDQTEKRIGKFLQKMQKYSALSESKDNANFEVTISNQKENSFTAYYTNIGKREAVLNFLTYLCNESKVGQLFLFTDEDIEWFHEDAHFLPKIAEYIHILVSHGWSFYRIEPKVENLDLRLKTIEQWMPAYMSGVIRDYYYPGLRDTLHRRTLFVAPEKIALYSRSLAKQKESKITCLTTDSKIVSICHEEIKDILSLCVPTMRILTNDNYKEMIDSLVEMASFPSYGIYKTASLSIPTIPSAILDRLSNTSTSQDSQLLIKSLRERMQLRKKILATHEIEDIMYLDNYNDIVNERVTIPISRLYPDGLKYYTVQEYKAHLENILLMLQNNANYQCIIANKSYWKDLILYGKRGGKVLIIKSHDPFTVFEITDMYLAISLFDFLSQISAQEKLYSNRNDTIITLKTMIGKLERYINENN